MQKKVQLGEILNTIFQNLCQRKHYATVVKYVMAAILQASCKLCILQMNDNKLLLLQPSRIWITIIEPSELTFEIENMYFYSNFEEACGF